HTRSKRDWSSDVCSSDLLFTNRRALLKSAYYGLLIPTEYTTKTTSSATRLATIYRVPEMYDLQDKRTNVRNAMRYLFSKTVSMFEWEGLLETLPAFELERLLQWDGFAYVTEHEGRLYAFTGGLGGEPDVYGRPTQIVVSNPALRFNATLNLERDG